MGAGAAAEAAVGAYRHARAAVQAVAAAAGDRVDPVARQRVLCHLLHRECAVLAGAAALPARAKAAAAARARAAACLDAARAAGCLQLAGEAGPGGSIAQQDAEGGDASRDEL